MIPLSESPAHCLNSEWEVTWAITFSFVLKFRLSFTSKTGKIISTGLVYLLYHHISVKRRGGDNALVFKHDL